MLRIKNSDGQEIIKLNDDGSEEIHDQKLKEQVEATKQIKEDK